MDFEFTEEQKLLRDSVIKLLERECPPEKARKWDQEAYFPVELYRQMAQMGFMGIPFPEEYGGSGLGATELLILQEQLAKRLLPVQMTYQVSIVVSGLTLLSLATEEQKKQYLPRLAKGDITFCIAFTEPNAGSDAASITTSAVLDGDAYRLNGQKLFITAASMADYMIVSTRTRKEGAKQEGITSFIIPTKTSGVEIREIEKLGLKSGSFSEIFFRDVRVEANNVLGGINKGWAVVTSALDIDRLCASARWVGFAQEALDYGMNYAKNRVQFDRPISKFQSVRDLLVESQVDIEAARLMTYRAAWMLDRHVRCSKEVSMAKLFASECVIKVVRNVMQTLGGYSFAMEYDAQRFLRDCQFATIGGGTSQIQKGIIARFMGL